MQAVILAGGEGRRLRAVLDNRPKPMAPIQGRPFLEYQIDLLKLSGITNFISCIGYLGDQIRSHFGDGGQWGLNIWYSAEKNLLGTAGALKKAEPLIQGTFLVMNGDTYPWNLDLEGMLDFHRHKVRRHGSMMLGTLLTAKARDIRERGYILVDKDGRILEFVEKPDITSPVTTLVNAGLYLLEPTLLSFIPVHKIVSLEKRLFPFLTSQRDYYLFSYHLQGDLFVDIGTPEGYSRAQSLLGGLG